MSHLVHAYRRAAFVLAAALALGLALGLMPSSARAATTSIEGFTQVGVAYERICARRRCKGAPPRLTVTTSHAGQVVGGKLTIAGSLSDPQGLRTVRNLRYRIGGGESVRIPVRSAWQFSFDTRDYADGRLRLTVVAVDRNRNKATARWQVMVENVADASTADEPPPADSTSEPPAAGYFSTLSAGSELPSGATCAAWVRRSSWEPRPENATANATVPASLSLPDWPGYADAANTTLKPRIDGNFTGTTDELIQWASCKWGFDEDLTRAQAVVESSWRQDALGDWESDQKLCAPGWEATCPTSFGILQIKHYYHPGTYPHSLRSTAFNLDYSLALRRACYEGWAYYGTQSRGDLWGCVGAHWSGNWSDPGSNAYATRVQEALTKKAWLSW